MHRPWWLISCLLALLLAAPALAQSPPTYLGSWGSAGTGAGQFQAPFSVAADGAGQVYVFDSGRVQIFTGDGAFVSQWATQYPLAPSGIAVDGNGRVHLLGDAYNSTFHEIYTTGGALIGSGILAGGGCECTLHYFGLAATPSGDSYLARWGSYHPYGQPSTPVAGIQHFISPSGEVWWGTPGASPGQFANPSGVVVDGNGFVYVADNGRVQKYANDGTFVTRWSPVATGVGQLSWWAIAIGPNGNVFTANITGSEVQEFTSDGTFVSRWGSSGSGPGQFSGPYGLAVDGVGNIFVADAGNYRIQKFGSTPTPTIHSSWGRLKSIYR